MINLDNLTYLQKSIMQAFMTRFTNEPGYHLDKLDEIADRDTLSCLRYIHCNLDGSTTFELARILRCPPAELERAAAFTSRYL